MNNLHTTTPQLGFNFDQQVQVTKDAGQPLLLVAMTHIADRLHTKIDMMRSHDNYDANVSITIKQDDKVLLAAALESDSSALDADKQTALRNVAIMARDADKKVFLSYDDVSRLFAAVSH